MPSRGISSSKNQFATAIQTPALCVVDLLRAVGLQHRAALQARPGIGSARPVVAGPTHHRRPVMTIVSSAIGVLPGTPCAAAGATQTRPPLHRSGTHANWSAFCRQGGCQVTLLGAVDGGASDTEQVGQFGGAVLTGLEQADQMCFLPGVELGLLAAEPTLGLRYLHPFSGAQPNQVGLELRDRWPTR
jgi:hypothetical protein